MRSILIVVFALLIGAAYGDYMIQGVRSGMDLIEQQRQS